MTAEAIRLVRDDGVGAAIGLATDEVLARRVGTGLSPATLRLYTYRSHCALVGRFQTIDSEIDRRFCGANDIELGRRPTGGGAIIMGEDQLGIALTVDGVGAGRRGHPRALMERFSRGLVVGLSRLGVAARFRGKNDLAVDGRKIAGLGVHRTETGGLLFHASVLVDLDVPLMCRVLRLPFASIGDRERKVVERRIATVRKVTGSATRLEEVRDHVVRGFDEVAGAILGADLDDEERAEAAELATRKYESAEWLHHSAAVRDGVGAATIATVAGRIEVRVAVAGGMLKAVHIGGDFFADDSAVAELEGRLRWHPSDPDAVRCTIDALHAENPGLETLPKQALLQAVLEAATSSRQESVTPYGCFVAPKAPAP